MKKKKNVYKHQRLLLLLAFPDVQDLSCAAVGPDALLILTAVDNLRIFAVAKICAVAAVL